MTVGGNAVKLMFDSFQTKSYVDGLISIKKEREEDGKEVSKKKWIHCYAEVVGLKILYWNFENPLLSRYSNKIKPLLKTKRDVSYDQVNEIVNMVKSVVPIAEEINISEAVCSEIGRLKKRDGLVKLQTGGSAEYHIYTGSEAGMHDWVLAIRLSTFQLGCIYENYTLGVIKEKYPNLLSGKYVDIKYTVKARLGNKCEWKETELEIGIIGLQNKWELKFWRRVDKNAKKKKNLSSTIFDVEALDNIYAIFSDKSTVNSANHPMLKVEGRFVDRSEEKNKKEETCDSLLILFDNSEEMFNTFLRLVRIYNLYGFPQIFAPNVNIIGKENLIDIEYFKGHYIEVMEQENARKKIRSIARSLVNGELVVPVGTNSRQLNGLKEQLSKFHTPVGENSQLRMEQSLYDNRNKTIRHKLTSGKLGFFFSRKKSRPMQPSQDDVHNFFDQKPVEVFQSKPIENNPPFEQKDFKIPEQDTKKLGLQSMVDIFPNFEASDTLNIESMMNKVSVMNLGDKPSTENGLKKQVDGSATIIKPVTNIHSGNKDDSDSEPDVPLSTVLTNTFGKSDGKKAKQNDLTQFTYDNLDAITANADLILDNDDLSIPYNNNGYNSKQSALNNCNNPVYTNPGQFGQGNMAMNQINTNSMIMNGMDISGQSQAGYGGVNTNSMVGINGFDQSMANIAGMQAMNDPQQMYSGNGYGNPNPMNPVEMGGQMNSNMYPINGGYDPAYGDMNVGYDGMMHHQSQDTAMLNNSYPGGLLGLAASYVPKTENVLGFPVPDEDMGGPLISVQKKTDTMQNPAGLVAAIANREQLKSDQKYRDSGSLMRGRQIKKMGETYGTVSGKSSRLGMSSSTFNQNDDTMSVVGGYASQTLGPRPATSMYFHESPHAMNENLGGSVMNGGRPLSMNVNSAFGGSVANLSAFVQNSGIGHSRSVLGYHTNHNAIDEMGVSGGSYEGFRPRSNIYGPSNSFTNLPQSFGIHANGGRPVSGIQSMGGPGFRGSTVGGKLGGYDGANRMSIMSSAGMGYPNNRLNRSSLVFNGNQPSDQTLNASIGNINAGYGIQNQQFSEEFPMNANPNRMSRVTHGFGQNSDFAPIGGNRGIHAPHNAPVFNQHLNNRNSTAFSSQLKQSSSLNSPVYQDFMIDLTITQKVAQNFEAFLDKCVDSKPYSVVTMSDVYSCYSRFCLKNGLTEEERPNIDQFIKMLKVADWTPKENKEGESSYYNMILV